MVQRIQMVSFMIVSNLASFFWNYVQSWKHIQCIIDTPLYVFKIKFLAFLFQKFVYYFIGNLCVRLRYLPLSLLSNFCFSLSPKPREKVLRAFYLLKTFSFAENFICGRSSLRAQILLDGHQASNLNLDLLSGSYSKLNLIHIKERMKNDTYSY